MKKLYYRLLLTLVVLACVLPFIMKDEYGRPMMTVSDLKMPVLKMSSVELPDVNIPDLNIPGQAAMGGLLTTDNDEAVATEPFIKTSRKGEVVVYKWKDDQGIWHFSNKENPRGNNEVMLVDGNRSVTSMTPVKSTVASAVKTTTQPSRAEALSQ